MHVCCLQAVYVGLLQVLEALLSHVALHVQLYKPSQLVTVLYTCAVLGHSTNQQVPISCLTDNVPVSHQTEPVSISHNTVATQHLNDQGHNEPVTDFHEQQQQKQQKQQQLYEQHAPADPLSTSQTGASVPQEAMAAGSNQHDHENLFDHIADVAALSEGDLSARDLIRCLWSLCRLYLLTLPRFGWLLVALGQTGWSKLNQQQLQVTSNDLCLLRHNNVAVDTWPNLQATLLSLMIMPWGFGVYLDAGLPVACACQYDSVLHDTPLDACGQV